MYEPPGTGTKGSTDITRGFFLLDHVDCDDPPGIASTVGSKLTAYRTMAEQISDHVCEKLSVDAGCRTVDEPLPGNEDFTVLRSYMNDSGLRSSIDRRSTQHLGSRANEVLNSVDPNLVVRECEVIIRAETQDVLDTASTDLNSMRIQTHTLTGNRQDAIHCHQMMNELAPECSEKTVRTFLDGLHQERWRGGYHAMWNTQPSQTTSKYMLHAATMNRDEDPAAADADVDFATFDDGIASGGMVVDGGRERVTDHADNDAFGGADGDS